MHSWAGFFREYQLNIMAVNILNARRMPGFLEVFGYYSEKLGKWNIDVCVVLSSPLAVY